jgi:hypothetical protein
LTTQRELDTSLQQHKAGDKLHVKVEGRLENRRLAAPGTTESHSDAKPK